MDRILQDLRFGWRTLLRRPTSALLAVAVFALGVAASTAMYSVVDAVLLRPLPYPEPERVVSVYTLNPEFLGHPTMAPVAERGWLSYPEYRDLRAAGEGILEGLAPLASTSSVVDAPGGPPERIGVGLTSPDLLARVLRVRPLHGRVFAEDDDVEAGLLVLAEGFWRRSFGGDPGVVGSTVTLGTTSYTVIGVVPAEAQVVGSETVDAWRILPPNDNRGNHFMTAIGRLAPGVSAERAGARLGAALSAAAEEAQEHGHAGVNVIDRRADVTRSARGPLLVLTGAALLLLLIACGNVAALLLGMAVDREQELAVRAALGAGRRRLLQQLLSESMVLAGTAAVLGIGLTALALRALVFVAPEGIPRIQSAAVDGGALGVAVGLALLCGLLFGMVPALIFSRTDLRRSLVSRGGTSRGRARLQAAVVVGELALATVLLVGAGLLVRTLDALSRVDPGFAAHEVLGVQMIPVGLTAGLESDSARFAAIEQFYRRVEEEVEALPGVLGVARTNNPPLSGFRGNNDVLPEGWEGEEELIAERRFVTHDYFDVMGIRVVEGRAFEAAEDRADAAPAVIVSEGLARRAWPNEPAVGKRLGWWGRESMVVGVVADVRDERVQSGTTYAFYVPAGQAGFPGGSLMIRAAGDPAELAPSVRQRIWSVHPDVAIPVAQPLSRNMSEQVAAERYRTRLVGIFSALAALFALMGIYGVTTRNVAARTRELGIRLALGAQRNRLVTLVVRQAVMLAVMGGLVGFVIALAATRLIGGWLYGVAPTDVITMVGTALVLGAASVVAALVPARRASRVDPMEVLRAE